MPANLLVSMLVLVGSVFFATSAQAQVAISEDGVTFPDGTVQQSAGVGGAGADLTSELCLLYGLTQFSPPDSLDCETSLINFPFGTIAGSEQLESELTDASFHEIQKSVQFDVPLTPQNVGDLTDGARTILNAGNSGGSSLNSEVFAFEVLAQSEGALLLKTEAEILYTDPSGKRTNFSVQIDGVVIGVLVTKAVSFPSDDPFTEPQAVALLESRLGDVVDSTANVAPTDLWSKQILFIFAATDSARLSLHTVLPGIHPDLKADTIVLIVSTTGDDDFLY